MSDKLKQLEIKKLLTEYETLVIDEQIQKEIIEINKEYFDKAVSEFIKENYQEDVGEKINESYKGLLNNKSNKNDNTEKTNTTLNENTDNSSTDKPKKNIKKIYREIVKKTHPDKTKSDNLINIYIKAKDLYEKNDILGLAYYAKLIDIDIDFDDDDIELIVENLKTKKNKIESIKNSIVYQWIIINNEETKRKLIEIFCKKISEL